MTSEYDEQLRALDDQELEAMRVAVLVEQDRRRNLTIIPVQIRAMAYAYEQGGGDLNDLCLDPLDPNVAPDPLFGLFLGKVEE